MPRRDTMHLRNSRVLALLLVFLFSTIARAQQSTPPPSPSANRPQAAPLAPSTSTNPPSGSPVPPPGKPPRPLRRTHQVTGASCRGPESAAPDPARQTPQNSDLGQAPTNDNSVFVFRKEVEEVILHATVVDDKHRLITNLDRNSFTVFENNQPQKLTSFRHEDIPVAMGIVIDNSGSMREKRDKVNKAALNLVRSSNPQDQVFVVNFNDEYYLDQGFTSDINKLREALEKVEARGGTALYDAIVASADYEKKQARLQKKVLFVVTDGEDNASRESLEEAVRRLQEENGPTVYAIGLLGEEKARRARRALETLAEHTGGICFLPKTIDEVDEISRTVAHDIRNQYTIGYKPSTPKSVGGYRTIRVEARAKGYGKLTVRTRSGYYPGQEQSGP